MTRLARLLLTLCAIVGFSTVAPAESQAGVIPWMYDAIFGPVGSIRANRAMYSSGTSGNYASYVNYTPMTVAYGPTAGCSCNQSSYYYAPSVTSSYGGSCSSCGTSGCSSCASGNCSANYGSTPVTSGYGPNGVPAPTPDPNLNNYNSYNSNSRDLNSRLNDIEHQLRVLDHRQREDEKFLDRQYEGKYTPSPYSSGTYGTGTYGRGNSETVPPRHRTDSFDSRGSESNFDAPRRRAPSQDPVEQDVRKPDLGVPTPLDEKSNGKTKGTKSGNESIETEPQALNLESRITSRAVAPRERMEIVTKDSKLKAIAKSNRRSIKTSENHQNTDLARQ